MAVVTSHQRHYIVCHKCKGCKGYAAVNTSGEAAQCSHKAESSSLFFFLSFSPSPLTKRERSKSQFLLGTAASSSVAHSTPQLTAEETLQSATWSAHLFATRIDTGNMAPQLAPDTPRLVGSTRPLKTSQDHSSQIMLAPPSRPLGPWLRHDLI
ncbi:hypothetical protein SODALDRAFT_332395 [Sodiomyces alkalinus F11]|uniref:Uncharacterized protein n=1 Tax=Sodiomyces alkalinus (strain CBS 110278 / VKM F-3762 / F11) TaxID=1314773 RepID=A0A3N2PWT8_SODAK|nr:hypothetical protein SODALDRAFT_332395 [Sodiomyces alkalinus F11]ROT38954.1 hypothetical protein SODALDRAFT_332395 [Sodiomyces alkalinus F11]